MRTTTTDASKMTLPIQALNIVFGAESSGALAFENNLRISIAAPVLGSQKACPIPLSAGQSRPTDLGWIIETGDLLFGFLRGRKGVALEKSTTELYERVFAETKSRHLQRIWHFLPAINSWHNGLENYRVFCRARADSFARTMGRDWQSRLPAASAVGFAEKEPVLIFAAGRSLPRHFENPEQVSAFHYPEKYGPRPPGFARATRAECGAGELVYLSGTAAIKGSETVCPGDCPRQLETTLENLGLIGETAGLGNLANMPPHWKRRMVVYIRRPSDFPLVSRRVSQFFPDPAQDVIQLQADLCREDLMVEIELTVFIPGRRS